MTEDKKEENTMLKVGAVFNTGIEDMERHLNRLWLLLEEDNPAASLITVVNEMVVVVVGMLSVARGPTGKLVTFFGIALRDILGLLHILHKLAHEDELQIWQFQPVIQAIAVFLNRIRESLPDMVTAERKYDFHVYYI